MSSKTPAQSVPAENLLDASGLPTFFEVAGSELPLPVNRHGQSVRVWARSLTVMQKEALVVSARSGRTWRLASDEGPYDAYFSVGGASGGTGAPGRADAIETHVYLRSSEDDEFARRAVDMGGQTCFLHALCRAQLDTRVSVRPALPR
jgi:hypothetical protein